jgi:hypothetical protein
MRARWAGNAWIEHSTKGPGCSTWRLPGRPSSSTAELEVELLSGEGALDFVEGWPATASK